jgi:hypothetical protein
MVSYVLAVHNGWSPLSRDRRIIEARNDSVNDMLGVLHPVSCSYGSMYEDLYHFVSLAYHLRYGPQWKPFQCECRFTHGEHAPVSTLTSTYGHAAVQASSWHHHCVCK